MDLRYGKGAIIVAQADDIVDLQERLGRKDAKRKMWKARARDMESQRDERKEAVGELQAELDKLRQARAQERGAVPHDTLEWPTGLLVEARDAVRAWHGASETKLLERIDAAIAAREPSDTQLVNESAELAATKEKLDRLDEENDELRGRVGYMDQRVKEISDQLADANCHLSNTQQVLDDTVKDRDLARGQLKECERLYQRAKADIDALEEQAEGYRKTIAQLRLTRPSSPLDTPASVSAWADTVGPDRITDANHVDKGGESYGGTS